VNTSFGTDIRRSFRSKIEASLQSTQTRTARSMVAIRCAKGLVISVAIGLAGSVVSSVTLPQEPASAASIAFHVSKGYLVRSGDSLSSVATRQNTTVAALAQANKLNGNAPLRIGQSLSLPKVELHGPKSLPTRLRANPKRLAVRTHTAKWAKANDIPRDLLEATLWQESGFDQSKVSSTGAIGVGQIMPETAGFIEKELIGVDLNPRNTENNVRMSARYLRYLLKANHSNTTKALHAYYQGMGSIQENGLYDDTIKYARNVQALRRHFKE
jgi:soluble lytic murein transglycosylase-like protein